jgi:hypothetical protein
LDDSRESESVPLVSADASVVAGVGVAGDHAEPFQVTTCPVVADDCVSEDSAWVCVSGLNVVGTFDSAVYEIVGSLAESRVPEEIAVAECVCEAAA